LLIPWEFEIKPSSHLCGENTFAITLLTWNPNEFVHTKLLSSRILSSAVVGDLQEHIVGEHLHLQGNSQNIFLSRLHQEGAIT
jgi:hypothetical protein